MSWIKSSFLWISTFCVLSGQLLCHKTLGQESKVQDAKGAAANLQTPPNQAGEEELKKLRAAVEADPADLKAQLTLAQRLFQIEKYQESWQLLRAVYDKSPKEEGALIGLQAVMDGYKRQGLLNAGTAEQDVLKLLGQPHVSKKMPWGIRHVYGMMAVDFRDEKVYELIKLIGATNELFDASHIIDVELDSRPAWKVGIRQKGDGMTTAFLFREGESIAKWNEMVTIERFVGQAEGKSTKEIVAKVEEQVKVGGADKLSLIEQDESTAIFAVNFPARENQAAKQQLVRLWKGTRDVHRLAYTHQGDLPNEKEQEKWYRIVKGAELKPYDPNVSKTSQAFSPQNQVKAIASALRLDLRKAVDYKPTEKSLIAIAANDESAKKLQAYCDAVYKELDQAGAAGKPNQTEILVFGPSSEELPGGYKDARQHFKADVKFYGFKYVAPGEKLGMSFDGVFEVDGKWYFLPKAHRAFR